MSSHLPHPHAYVEAIYRGIGARIQALRLRRGLTQAQLGAELEPPITRAAIANIESAKQRLLSHTAIQLAGIFGESIESVLMVPGLRRRLKPRHVHRFFTDEDGACHPCRCGEPYPGTKRRARAARGAAK